MRPTDERRCDQDWLIFLILTMHLETIEKGLVVLVLVTVTGPESPRYFGSPRA